MQRAPVVESDATMTRQALRNVGFDDNQAQALVDLSGTSAERRELKADVTTLKTDVVDLQQGLATFRTETRGEFARLDARFDGLRDEMNAKFDGLRDEMNARFGGVDAQFGGVDARFGGVDARFKGLEDRMDARFDGMDARFDGMDARFDGMESRMKLMLWIMGIGAAVYTGTSASLLVLLYRVVVV